MAKDWQQSKCPLIEDCLYVVLCLCSLQEDEESTDVLRKKDLQDMVLSEKGKALDSICTVFYILYFGGIWVLETINKYTYVLVLKTTLEEERD